MTKWEGDAGGTYPLLQTLSTKESHVGHFGHWPRNLNQRDVSLIISIGLQQLICISIPYMSLDDHVPHQQLVGGLWKS